MQVKLMKSHSFSNALSSSFISFFRYCCFRGGYRWPGEAFGRGNDGSAEITRHVIEAKKPLQLQLQRLIEK